MAKKQSINQRLDDLVIRLNSARSALFVSAMALEHGDTDLELQAATTLLEAYSGVNVVYDELVSMRNEADRGGPTAAAKADQSGAEVATHG